MTPADSTLLDRFRALDSPAVSDALDALDLPAGLGGLRPMWGRPVVVGFARTVALEPAGPSSGAHIGATEIAAAGADDVMVVANEARGDVSCWGGLLSLGAALRGVRGAVVDGVCRDVDEARTLGFPVYARGCCPRTARGRLRLRASGEPVDVAGTTVVPGDVILADEVGLVVVPRTRADEVLAESEAVRAREAAIAADLRAGVDLPEAMRDARLAGTS